MSSTNNKWFLIVGGPGFPMSSGPMPSDPLGSMAAAMNMFAPGVNTAQLLQQSKFVRMPKELMIYFIILQMI